MQLVSLNLPFQWTRAYVLDKYDSEKHKSVTTKLSILTKKMYLCVFFSDIKNQIKVNLLKYHSKVHVQSQYNI
jgi:hypothetical protein